MPQLDPNTPCRVLVTSPLDPKEFPGIAATRGPDFQIAHGPHDAAKRLSETSFDVVLHPQPRQLVNAEELVTLAKQAGEAICVQLLGTWCEGEQRTGKIAEGWERVFWHAWPRWWEQQLGSKSGMRTDLRASLVELVARRPLAEAIHCALEAQGWIPMHQRPGPPTTRFDAGLWVGKQLGGFEAERLEQYCARFRTQNPQRRTVPVVAMLDFPRRETVCAARAIGVAQVVAMPCDAEDLSRALRRAMTAAAVRVPLPARLVLPEEMRLAAA